MGSWVGEEDWSYSGQFLLTTDQLEVTTAQLDCHGLDTVAEVVVNGVHVGSAANMFVRYLISAS